MRIVYLILEYVVPPAVILAAGLMLKMKKDMNDRKKYICWLAIMAALALFVFMLLIGGSLGILFFIGFLAFFYFVLKPGTYLNPTPEMLAEEEAKAEEEAELDREAELLARAKKKKKNPLSKLM